MRQLRVLLSLITCLLSLITCSPAFAALSVIKGAAPQGNPPAGCALSGSVGSGQVVLLFATGGTLPGSATVSDNVNSGNYSILYSYSAQNMVIYWKITNASGTPTVSISGPGGYTNLWCMGVTGFVGTPTSDSTIQNTATGTSTTPTISATSNFNNEILLMGVGISYTQPVTASGWSNGTAGSAAGYSGLYAIEASSGTADNFNGAWGTSQLWFLQLAGIYDPGAGVAPHPVISNGHVLMSNGHPVTGMLWPLEMMDDCFRRIAA